MTVQTSYERNIDAAFEGLLGDRNPKILVTKIVEAADGINFGRAVSRGTNKAKQVLLGAADFVGITYRSLEREVQARGSTDIKYTDKDECGVLQNGYIWLRTTNACDAGDQVKVNTTTGVFGSGAKGNGEVNLDGATWESKAAAGGLALLYLRSFETS